MNFGELNGNIRERKEQIRIRQEEIPRLLTIDERLRVTIAPEYKERAAEIAAKIKELRQKNEAASAILEKAQEISGRYNVPLDELHQLSLSIPYLEKHIAELEERIETTKKTDPKKFAAEKDSSVSRIGQDVQKLERARKNLENHREAKVAIDSLLQEIQQQGAK